MPPTQKVPCYNKDTEAAEGALESSVRVSARSNRINFPDLEHKHRHAISVPGLQDSAC